nr:putative ribonuclease H-like domain-containing protein [Tanacetum cinerariifolium]
MIDYALWEVILNGDSPPPTRYVEGVETPYPPTTVEEKLDRKNELKDRGYDCSDQAKDGPTNFALMAHTFLSSLSSLNSDTEVSTCFKACLKSYETLKEHYDNLTKDFNKSQFNLGAYKAGLESIEARLESLDKNLEKLKKKKGDLKLTLEKFQDSSKNPSRMLDSQQSDNSKTDLGYDSQGFDILVLENHVTKKYNTCEGYHAVLPPYTGNFMPPKPDLVFANEHVVIESVTSLPDIAKSEVKTSEITLHNVSALIIEDWVSDSKDEDEIETESNKIKPSFANVKFIKTIKHVKSLRKSVKKEENNRQTKYPRKNSQNPREFDGGFIALEEALKELKYMQRVLFTKIECLVLSPDFKLLDENQVLLKVPRNNNMYSFDLQNVAPSGGLTCLFVKATIDESRLWHRRLGHINFKTMNKLVRGNLVRDHLGKFKGKADEGFLVGYSVNSKTFRVFNSRTRKVEENLHIKFIENKLNVVGRGLEWLFDIDSLAISMNYKPVTTGNQNNHDAERTDSSTQDVNTVRLSINNANTNINTGSLNINIIGPNDPSMPSLEKTGIFDDAYNDREVGAEADTNNFNLLTVVSPVPTIRVYKDHPKEQIIGDLNLATQTTRTIKFSEENAMMDVKSAFLYGTIEEEVYEYQPLGFENPYFPNKVYKVEKALYGLHQAPRAWYDTLSTYLLENGFKRRIIDKTLFIKKDKDDILLVQVYVDDIIVGSTKKLLCDEFEQIMHKRFQISSMGELIFFLGLQVKQKDNGIFISQDKYVADILKKFDFSSLKTASTPIETNKALLKNEEAQDFWTSAKVKTVNEDVRLQVLVDGKKVILNEASIRRDLRLDDAKGTACLPNAAILEELARIGRKQRNEPEVSQDEPPTKEHIPTPSHDPLPSGEDRLQLNELMEICTKSSNRVLSLEQIKTNQAAEIEKLKKRGDQKDASKQGRIAEIDADADISLINETAQDQGRMNEEDLFGVHDLDGDEVFVDVTTGKNIEQSTKNAEKEVSTANDEVVTTTEDVKVTATAITPQISKDDAKDKGKGIMIEPKKPLKKKDQIALNEEVARNLKAKMKAKIDEEERIAREKNKANIVRIEEWDDVQAIIDANKQLAE